MTIKEGRKMFWESYVTDEQRKEHRVRKTQNDYSCDIRMQWCDFVDSMRKDGRITERQAFNWTL